MNVSLGNLLSYPFVKERVVKNKLALRGAHYDFVKGTFDLWELDFKTTPAFSFSYNIPTHVFSMFTTFVSSLVSFDLCNEKAINSILVSIFI